MDRTAEIREKRAAIRQAHGGMMTSGQLANELGYRKRDSARKWAEEHGIPAIRRGKNLVYESDLVAKAIVYGRGMV